MGPWPSARSNWPKEWMPRSVKSPLFDGRLHWLCLGWMKDTPWKINIEHTKHPFRKENDLNQTSMLMEPMLIFRGVWWSWLVGCESYRPKNEVFHDLKQLFLDLLEKKCEKSAMQILAHMKVFTYNFLGFEIFCLTQKKDREHRNATIIPCHWSRWQAFSGCSCWVGV